MRSLGKRRDLAGSGDAADDANVRPDQLDGVAGQKHLELPHRRHALPGRDRDGDLVCDIGHLIQIVGQDWVFDEDGIEGFDGSP